LVGTIEQVVYKDAPNESAYLVKLLQSLKPELSVVPLHIGADHILQHNARELDNKYIPSPCDPDGPPGPVGPTAPYLVYDDPLGPIDPLKFSAILAVNTFDVINDARLAILALVTDTAKFILLNGYDCILNQTHKYMPPLGQPTHWYHLSPPKQKLL